MSIPAPLEHIRNSRGGVFCAGTSLYDDKSRRRVTFAIYSKPEHRICMKENLRFVSLQLRSWLSGTRWRPTLPPTRNAFLRRQTRR